MSLFALAERAAAERPPVPEPLADGEMGPPVPQAAPAAPAPPARVGAALKTLVDFVPTEVIALYWLAVPAASGLAKWFQINCEPSPFDYAMYFVLLALTPGLLLLAYLSNLASQNSPRPAVRDWPWWKAIASTIAFAAWALAVPGNPFFKEPLILMAIWVGATLVAVVLALLDPIILQWKRPPV
jgi:hypothetical protein